MIFVGDGKSRVMTNLHQLRRNSFRFFNVYFRFAHISCTIFSSVNMPKVKMTRINVSSMISWSRGDEGPFGVGPKVRVSSLRILGMSWGVKTICFEDEGCH